MRRQSEVGGLVDNKSAILKSSSVANIKPPKLGGSLRPGATLRKTPGSGSLAGIKDSGADDDSSDSEAE